jgi:hypothetical protein
VQKVEDARADPCQVIFPSVSETEDTVTVVAPSLATIDRTTTSLEFVVLNEGIVKDEPDVQVPEALPSSAGEGGSANNWNDNEPDGIDVGELNWGDQRYMLEPAGSVKEPAA